MLLSKLEPGALLQAHSGPTNVVLIGHLPLIIPPEGCAMRVGSETRPWTEGTCCVFDHTFEHEAWNRSARDRYILIFVLWHPDLTPAEQTLFKRIYPMVSELLDLADSDHLQPKYSVSDPSKS